MQPSSLIFVLVIAIWAAYLFQHWLRRREHLSTARTIDRFSASMRVLDRTKAGRSSASGGMSTTGSIPLHRRSTGLAVREVAGGDTMAVPVPEHEAVDEGAPPVRRIAGVSVPRVSVPRVSVPRVGLPRMSRPEPSGPAVAADREARLRRVLGGTLLLAAGVALFALPLAVFGMLSWVVPGVALLLAGGALVGLRRLAAQAVSRRMATRVPARDAVADGRVEAPARRGSVPRRRASARPAAPTRPGSRRASAGRRPETAGTGEVAGVRETATARETIAAGAPAAYGPGSVETTEVVSASARSRDDVFDLVSLETSLAAARGVPAEVEGGWSPVPVPPPTYTLKAKAVYAQPEDDDDVVSPYAPVSDLAERRRLASG